MPVKHLQTLFAGKAWSNREAFDALAKANLPETRLPIRLLNHVYVVDRIFQGHLQGEPHGFKGVNTPETPTIENLRAAVAELDQWYVDYVRDLAADKVDEIVDFTFTDGKPGRMTRGEMLLHIATHGFYHRGAVGQILSNHGAEAAPDGLTVFLPNN